MIFLPFLSSLMDRWNNSEIIFDNAGLSFLISIETKAAASGFQYSHCSRGRHARNGYVMW